MPGRLCKLIINIADGQHPARKKRLTGSGGIPLFPLPPSAAARTRFFVNNRRQNQALVDEQMGEPVEAWRLVIG